MTGTLATIIAVNIRTLRKARGMSQRDLAAATGVSQRAVSAWENGEGLTAVNLVAVADALEVSVTQLIGRDGPDAFWDGFQAGLHAGSAKTAAEVAQ